ncbi:MAG: hypothetical protein JO061_17020 [Acidobacteriaceae bacterium]|nr:hypothetical protein [Acidobacteriaceae bacterium]
MLNKLLLNSAGAIGALVFLPLLVAETAPNPNLSGSWQVDPAKSQAADGKSLTLTIVQTAENIKIEGVAKDSSKPAMHLNCKTDGSDCFFDDSGHKSKASIWSTGSELVICKTDGPPGDLVNEWHMKVSSDNKTLTVQVEHIDPAAANETLVLAKKTAD